MHHVGMLWSDWNWRHNLVCILNPIILIVGIIIIIVKRPKLEDDANDHEKEVNASNFYVLLIVFIVFVGICPFGKGLCHLHKRAAIANGTYVMPVYDD